jgi:hypothetical protein
MEFFSLRDCVQTIDRLPTYLKPVLVEQGAQYRACSSVIVRNQDAMQIALPLPRIGLSLLGLRIGCEASDGKSLLRLRNGGKGCHGT